VSPPMRLSLPPRPKIATRPSDVNAHAVRCVVSTDSQRAACVDIEPLQTYGSIGRLGRREYLRDEATCWWPGEIAQRRPRHEPPCAHVKDLDCRALLA
jgi:hypothetical protein